MASSEHPSELLCVRLSAVEYGAQGINTYRFSSLDGSALPSFDPGAHIDVVLGPQMTRQYSLLWPSPSPADYVIAVQVAEPENGGKGGSRMLHYESVVGATYQISPPRNHFPLEDGGPCHLLAGGIGITPLISMYRQLRETGRPVTLYYWAGSADHMLFHRTLSTDTVVRLFETRRGGMAPPRLKDIVAQIPADAHLYCCGPASMVDEFDNATADRPESMVHRERFSATVEALQPGDGFTVTLQRSGKTLYVSEGQTLLQVCEAAGADVAYSCEEGVCGACEVKVLGGQVMHRDSVLTAAQKARSETMMICCSRGIGSGLVLDL